MHNHQFTSGPDAQTFLLAGRARLTLVSPKTGARYTFRVSRKDETSPWFVSLLSGSDNDRDYTFLGTIFADGSYRHGKKSPIGVDAPSAKAFAWAWGFLAKAALPPCEVWHEGACGKCGRALTVPSSISSGFGPECIKAVAA